VVGYLVGDERVGFLLAVGFHQLLVTHASQSIDWPHLRHTRV